MKIILALLICGLTYVIASNTDEKCNKPHQVYSPCNAHCGKTCSNYNTTIVCTRICKPGCVCEDGWVKNEEDDTCVTTDQCHTCPNNEKWVNCVLGYCVPKTCDDLGNPVACPDIIGPCAGGCVCIDDYLRDKWGRCVHKTECPCCGGDKNATSGCSNYCNNKCSDYNQPPRPCPYFCAYNGCECREGYVYDSEVTGQCVLPSDCPQNDTNDNCTDDETDPMPEPINDEDNTSDNCADDETDPMPEPINDEDNTSSNCTDDETDPMPEPINDEDNTSDNCTDDETDPMPEPINDEDNTSDNCTDDETDPMPEPINDKEKTSDNCTDDETDPMPEPINDEDNTSDNCTYDETDPMPYPINDEDNTNEEPYNGSVPESDPGRTENEDTYEPTNDSVNDKTQILCPRNEKWVDCERNVCLPKKCSELGFPLNCTKVDEKHCPGGCICATGRLRDSCGKCVPIDQCPSCGGDKNATQGCGVYCGNMCSDYQDPDKKCGIGCIFNGCKCRQGFVYDEESLKKCILPKDCPPTCKDPNAEQVSCASNCPATCAYPNPCPCPYNDCTKNGCQCKQGYVLSETGGKCTKISECPCNLGCNGDRNATIKELPSPCPPTCDVPKPKICPAIAILVGCECNPGFIKSSNTGKCIDPKDCRAKC